jgi:hypothetical protein
LRCASDTPSPPLQPPPSGRTSWTLPPDTPVSQPHASHKYIYLMSEIGNKLMDVANSNGIRSNRPEWPQPNWQTFPGKDDTHFCAWYHIYISVHGTTLTFLCMVPHTSVHGTTHFCAWYYTYIAVHGTTFTFLCMVPHLHFCAWYHAYIPVNVVYVCYVEESRPPL